MDVGVVEIDARTDKDHTTSVSGGLTVSRKAETSAAVASRMEFEKVTLHARGLFGVAYSTRELLTRTPRAFAAILSAGFRDQFASHLINERINGTGAGEFLGFMKSPCLATVAKESAQVADTIVTANILKMRARAWGYQNAVWLANHDTIPQLGQLQGGDNAHIYMPSMREDIPDILLGRPIVFTEYMETLGDLGDIACCNFTQYLEGTLTPLMGEESIHVRFLEHENTFKFWLENDGAPWWRAGLTPKKGAATLSPFVALAARA